MEGESNRKGRLFTEGKMNTEGDPNLRIVENPAAPLIYADGLMAVEFSRDDTMWMTLYNIVQEPPKEPRQEPETVKRVAARITLSKDAQSALADIFFSEYPSDES